MQAIKTAKLTKYYGGARGIVDLDLEVGQGELFGFIGPNGAGKSTAIRALLGLIAPTSGSAEIFGMDVTRERRNILREVGYLPAEAVFYRGMRVRDALKLSAELRRADCAVEAGRLCERLRLDVSRRIDELSFGSRKKVAVVCALQHRPRLLVLDEPTGGLDPLMQREFFEIIRERNREGTTVLMSSHVLSEIQRNCTRAAIIRDGRVIACGSVDELSRASAKRVAVRGVFSPQGLAGVRDLKRQGELCSFLYAGDMNSLLRALSAGEIDDLAVSEPDLEEVFMHYYEKEGERA